MNPEPGERECGREVRHPSWTLPEVLHTKCCVLIDGKRAGVRIRDVDHVSVFVECRVVARAELGEGGVVLAGKGGFFLGDVGGLNVEQRMCD